ncbi:MAG: hypothetical protein GW763_13595 [Paraglaciecola sp.]|nr:hypothetical protein [Paraglaciecola sp.]NCT48994.1 hypothetical protein [Paraglaciecola sp.]
MLLRAYFPQVVTTVLAGIFIALGIFSFGKPAFFDRLFLCVLIFTAVVCYQSINILSLLILLIIARSIEELAWLAFYDSYLISVFINTLTIAVLIFLRFDPLSKLGFLIVTLAMCAEIYWMIIDYPAPELYWHVTLLLISFSMRYLSFMRFNIVDRFFPGKSKPTHLDWAIYNTYGFAIIIQSAVLLEYLVRHVLGYSQVLVVYNAYVYLVHGIAVYVVFAIVNEIHRDLLQRLLKA